MTIEEVVRHFVLKGERVPKTVAAMFKEKRSKNEIYMT